MRRNNPGYFITLEGPEGSGKSSHISGLADFVRGFGLSVYVTREPGGTPIGDKIREIVHDSGNEEIHVRTETLLYQASRAQIVEQIIKPKLAEGTVVLCDRYADSTFAYQREGRGQDWDTIAQIVRYATGDLAPDLTLLLDIEPELGLERKRRNNAESNRMDRQSPEFYRRVRKSYLQMADNNDYGRWVIIDASSELDIVQGRLRRAVEHRLISDGLMERKLGPER